MLEGIDEKLQQREEKKRMREERQREFDLEGAVEVLHFAEVFLTTKKYLS